MIIKDLGLNQIYNSVVELFSFEVVAKIDDSSVKIWNFKMTLDENSLFEMTKTSWIFSIWDPFDSQIHNIR
jgi:hypothetical protein